MSSIRLPSRPANGLSSNRIGRVNIILTSLFHACVPAVKAIPLPFGGTVQALGDEDLPKSAGDASLWVYLGFALFLVLAGGVFAGLTIA